MQCLEMEHLDIHDDLINTNDSKSERTAQFSVFLVWLFNLFFFSEKALEELQIIITKKLIVKFCQIIGFSLL